MAMTTMEKPRKVPVRSIVDEDTKQQATELYAEIGMSLSTAINVFLRQSVAEGCMPFTPGRPKTVQKDSTGYQIAQGYMKNGKLVMPVAWRDEDDADQDW